MVRYYKTTGIYAGADLLKVSVKYSKEVGGYFIQVEPCSKVNSCETFYYYPEYYKYYGTLRELVVNCGRRSEKRYNEACAICNKMIGELFDRYVKHADEKGGRHIEIIGELED
jgi:hypothetical protein